jgi:hypothetical protein
MLIRNAIDASRRSIRTVFLSTNLLDANNSDLQESAPDDI